MGEILQVRGIFMAFRGIQALANVGFTVRQGEIVGIIGPNGAGKTVLLNCISGIHKPNRGEIVFDGHVVTGFRDTKWHPWGSVELFNTLSCFKE